MNAVLLIIGFLAIIGSTLTAQIETQDEEYIRAVTDEQRVFEGKINSTLNKLIEQIAPYDPIITDHEEINIVGHHGEVNNVHVQGFSNVAATHISLGGLITWTLEMTIEAPLITANIDHWKVTGPFFFGDGALSVNIEKITFKVHATVNPITQYVKTLKLTPGIEKAEVSITGLYDDPKLSESISNMFNYLLNDFVNNEEFHDALSKFLLKLLQNM